MAMPQVMRRLLTGQKLEKIIFLAAILCFSLGVCFSWSQEAVDLGAVSGEYFAKGDFDGFYQYVVTAEKEKKISAVEADYYLALTRQMTIDSWVREKNWEGVYDQAEEFKKEILRRLSRAQAASQKNPVLLFKIKFLEWQRIQEDDSDSGADLFGGVVEAAKEAARLPEGLAAVKQAAEALSSREDKNLSRRLYDVYVARLMAADRPLQELKKDAEKFLADRNVYLAKTLFDAYLSRITDEPARLKERVAIATLFAHQDAEEGLDPVFAETMYQQAFEAAGISVFDAASQYRRAFNLERMKEYQAASLEYSKLLFSFADYADRPSVEFRLGVLSAYALKDTTVAAGYFLKVKDQPTAGRLVLSACYQLGLLEQAAGNAEKASAFYKDCLDAAGAQGIDPEKSEICLLCQQRLSEIGEKKEISYGLRLFLEATLKKGLEGELGPIVPLSVDLTGRPAKQAIGAPVHFVITTSNPQTGCMTPVYAYEWSGETGSIANIPNSPELTTDYASPGIKVLHAAVVGPNGLEGAGFEMVEVTEKPKD